MGLRKWIFRGLVVGGMVAMSRSKNAALRRIGRAGSFLVAPRLVRVVGRR